MFDQEFIQALKEALRLVGKEQLEAYFTDLEISNPYLDSIIPPVSRESEAFKQFALPLV